jgi:hypothetical protein
MSTLVTVRPVAPADFDKWLLLWQGYNLFYGRPSLPAEITQMTWSRLFDAYEPVHALAAERNPAVSDVPDPGNELVGLVHYLFHRSTIHIAPVCYLQDLFTTEAARGQGGSSARLLANPLDQLHRHASLRPSGRTLRLRRLSASGLILARRPAKVRDLRSETKVRDERVRDRRTYLGLFLRLATPYNQDLHGTHDASPPGTA